MVGFVTYKEINLDTIEMTWLGILPEMQNKKIGNISEITAFSFYATKNITSGEGGAAATNRKDLDDYLRMLRLHGIDRSAADRYTRHYRHWDMPGLGWKYNMDNIHASLLIGQIDRIEDLRRRREMMRRHNQRALPLSLRAACGALLLCLLPLGALAQAKEEAPLPTRITIDVDSPERALYRIAIPNLLGPSGLGSQSAEVIRNDLKLVSLFNVLDARSFIADLTKQFAVLKAIGLTNLRIVLMVLAQAVTIGFIGYGLGLWLATGFFDGVNTPTSDLKGFYLPWQIAVAAAVATLLISVLATFVSLRKVLRLDPATVFRG